MNIESVLNAIKVLFDNDALTSSAVESMWDKLEDRFQDGQVTITELQTFEKYVDGLRFQ